MKTLIAIVILALGLVFSSAASAYLVPYNPSWFANAPEPPAPPRTEDDHDEIVEMIAEYLDEETGEVTRVFVTRKGWLIYQKFGVYSGTHSVTQYPPVSASYDDGNGNPAYDDTTQTCYDYGGC